jgi:hypothetical protein
MAAGVKLSVMTASLCVLGWGIEESSHILWGSEGIPRAGELLAYGFCAYSIITLMRRADQQGDQQNSGYFKIRNEQYRILLPSFKQCRSPEFENRRFKCRTEPHSSGFGEANKFLAVQVHMFDSASCFVFAVITLKDKTTSHTFSLRVVVFIPSNRSIDRHTRQHHPILINLQVVVA